MLCWWSPLMTVLWSQLPDPNHPLHCSIQLHFITLHTYSKRLEECKESQDKVTGHKYRGWEPAPLLVPAPVISQNTAGHCTTCNIYCIYLISTLSISTLSIPCGQLPVRAGRHHAAGRRPLHRVPAPGSRAGADRGEHDDHVGGGHRIQAPHFQYTAQLSLNI